MERNRWSRGLGMVVFAGMAIFVSASARAAFSIDDVQFWAGSGGNRAVLVVDWQDSLSPVALAWGYRWDGTASGEDMLTAIEAADSAFVGTFAYYSGMGIAVNGLGYDLDGDGFSETDPDDHFNPGYVAPNYWSYYVSDGNPGDGYSWSASASGASDRVLTDGAWDGWIYADGPAAYGGAGTTPGSPVAAVPEPGTLSLCLVGVGLLMARFRGRRG